LVSTWSRQVTHYRKDFAWTPRDISADVLEIPSFTASAAGQINSAIINISANNGQYIKNFGSKLKIKILDRIRLEVTDSAGLNYNHVFDVVKRLPIKTKEGGTILQLTLLGIERWLQEVKYIRTFYHDTLYSAAIDLLNTYNDDVTVATGMPICTIGTIELPKKGFHNINFGINEDSIFNRLLELTDKGGSSAADGGVLDFFDLKFTSNPAVVNAFTVDIISSGNVNAGKPSITINSTNVNTGETEGGLEEVEATLLGSWGAPDAGSLPVNFSKFKSRQILLPTSNAVDSLFPPWLQNQSPYKSGSIVTHVNLVWRAIADTNTTPSFVAGAWEQLTPQNYYGGNIKYSLWTDGRATEWKNAGADPTGTKGPYGRCMWDGNLIINDKETFRTWVDVKATSPSGIDSKWLYDGTDFYDGFRVLVRGTGTGAFAGHNNKILEYRNDGWTVKYDEFLTTSGTFGCAVIDEARNYWWHGNVWEDRTNMSGVLGSDCFHPYENVTNTESAIKNADTKAEFIGNNSFSAISFTYEWTPLLDWVTTFFQDKLPILINANYYKSGAWLCFRFPFPKNKHNDSTLNVGELYGGNTTYGIVPYLDFNNMHQSHDGRRGFNQIDVSEEYGQINAIEFLMKLKMESKPPLAGAYGLTIGAANFKMRCWLIDRNDHVVSQDFIIHFNDEWQSISLPINGFEIYRGFRPRFAGDFSTIVPPKGLDPVESFEWRHVMMMCIGTVDSYNEFNQYKAGQGMLGVGWGDFLSGISRRMQLSIDALRFRKPLLVTSGQVTDIAKTGEFLQRPDIGNYEQLKQDVLAELEKAKFESKQYDITTDGSFNIAASDFFNFEDPEIVEEGSNVIKLVAKHIDYSITKPVQGKGGFLRTIRGMKRFE